MVRSSLILFLFLAACAGHRARATETRVLEAGVVAPLEFDTGAPIVVRPTSDAGVRSSSEAPGNDKCIPGVYVGTGEMTYVPGPAGLCGLVTLFGGSGSAHLKFSLSKSGTAEFYDVKSGCLNLLPIDAGVPEANAAKPKRGLLEAKVDCTTGKFEGVLRGGYRSVSFCDLGMMQNDYYYKGPMTATYNPATKTFENGIITLKEPPVLLPLAGEAGGAGTWSATLDPTATLSDSEDTDCLNGERFPDEMFPAP